MQLILHKFYDRVEQVGQKPGDEEGQQYAAQFFHKPKDSQYGCSYECPADKPVESDFFSHLFSSFSSSLAFR